MDEKYVARRSVRDLPAIVAGMAERLAHLSADQTTVQAGGPITIGGRPHTREEAHALIGARLERLPRNVHETTRVPMGVYRGLRFGMVLHPQFPPDVYLEGTMTRHDTLSREHQGPRALLNALERLVNSYDSECAAAKQHLAIAETQLRDYQARLGKPFPHDDYLSELTDLRDQLKARLSGTAIESGDEFQPTISEIAEHIKSLKAAHTIEASPQRLQQRHLAAEIPVTGGIRRRHGATPAVPAPNSPPASSIQPMSFWERLGPLSGRRREPKSADALMGDHSAIGPTIVGFGRCRPASCRVSPHPCVDQGRSLPPPDLRLASLCCALQTSINEACRFIENDRQHD